MLSRDLRALAAWFGPVAAGDFEMTAEGARAFMANLNRAVEDAEALEQASVAPDLRRRAIAGGNVVAFRPRSPASARGSTGGDAA